MARYEYGCYPCNWVWEIQHSMDTISSHQETCPDCGETATRLYSVGMIKVSGGHSPTRIGDGYQRVAKSRDTGFQREFNSIFSEAGMEVPGTGERYETMDDEGGSGPYLAVPSDKEAYRKGVEIARERGTLPTQKEMDDNRAKFLESGLQRARERLRQWPAGRKGRKT